MQAAEHVICALRCLVALTGSTAHLGECEPQLQSAWLHGVHLILTALERHQQDSEDAATRVRYGPGMRHSR